MHLPINLSLKFTTGKPVQMFTDKFVSSNAGFAGYERMSVLSAVLYVEVFHFLCCLSGSQVTEIYGYHCVIEE